MRRTVLSVLSAFLVLCTLPARAQSDGYGDALAVSDASLFVGEPLNEATSGVVYVYSRDGEAWSEQTQLTASDAHPGDRFGMALAVDSTTLLVGAPNQQDGQGAAYLFAYDASLESWTETGRLTATDGAAEDRFGVAVALDGDVALVGTTAQGEGTGAVYVFRRDEASGSWMQETKLVGSGVMAGDQFGAALALEAGVALVGAPGQGTGAVYAFRHDGAQWAEDAILLGGGTSDGDRFGEAIALQDNLALIGASRHGTGAAFAFLYDALMQDWQTAGTLRPFDGGRQDRFGTAVALNGDEAWVGAPRANDRAGRAYRFLWDGTTWTSSVKVPYQPEDRQAQFAGHLAVRGDVAAVTMTGADLGAGTVAVFERTDTNWEAQEVLAGEMRGYEAIAGERVLCESGEAAQFDCSRVDLLSFLPISEMGGGRGVRVNDIWGWTDPETNREYALVGRVDGTSFVDVTDPLNPVYVGNLPKTEEASIAVWRDIKVYQDHAYVVADGVGPHGMQVFDLARLRDFDGTPLTFAPDTTYHEIHSAHNIVINEESGFAYTVGNSSGGMTCGGGLHMIDIREPKNPIFAGCFADVGTGRSGTGYTHDAQCVMYRGPDADHQGREICFGANETHLSIADVTDKENPVSLARASYPNVAYTHQGWLTEDQRYFYINDELDELGGNVSNTRTLIWDVSDLDDPQLVKEFLLSTEASDHNLYIKGNVMYQSNYYSGLRVLDITDPANPVEAGHFDTVPYGTNEAGFGGSWSNYPFFKSGTIAVTSMSEGLFLVRKHDVDI